MKVKHISSNAEHSMPMDKLLQAYKLFFGTLTSKDRLRIINLLRKKPNTVSEIQNELEMEQTVLSHNLKRLRHCGFVDVKKKGKYRIYVLNKSTIAQLMNIIDRHMKKYCMKIVGDH